MQVSPQIRSGKAGRCPRHSDEAVFDTCSRCGDYVCLECAHVEVGLSYCEACRPSKGTLPQADLGQRFFGNLFDQAMVWGPFAIAGIAQMHGAGLVVVPLLMLTVNAYLLHRRGQSIGKLAMGSRIVTKDYRRAPLWRLFLVRFPIQAIGAVTGVSSIDAAFVLGSERRTLHDRAAGTRVVDADASEFLYL